MIAFYLLIVLNITVIFLAYIFIKKNLAKIKELECDLIVKKETIQAQLLQLDTAHQAELENVDESLRLHGRFSEIQLDLQKSKSDLLTLNKSMEVMQSNHRLELKKTIETTRKETLKKSRAILRGQASEHLAPYVIKGTNPKDYRFMGNPIDYICFDGLSDLLDGQSNSIKSIRFVDIKTGKSSLNKSQRRIRDAIVENKVTFEVINLDDVIANNSSKEPTKLL